MNNKTRGLFLGLAIGDAVGMPAEFMQPGSFEPVTNMRAGGVFNLPAGYWTDDTSMALCLADSLLECGGYDSYDVMNKYRSWWQDGYRSSQDHCFDIGNQVQQALRDFITTPEVIPTTTVRSESAGNGTVMRLAPAIIAAYSHRSPEEIIQLARISARETHYSLEAEIGTEVFAALLINALKTDLKRSVLDVSKHSTGGLFAELFERITDTNNLNNSGYIIHSLQVAVWAFLKYDSFEEGMLAAINLGGDSDTNGAIYGQLAGAFYGYDAIPQHWRDELFQKDELITIADKLTAMPACPMIQTRFEEDF